MPRFFASMAMVMLAFSSFSSFAKDCTASDYSAELAWPTDEPVPVDKIPVEHWFRSGSDWILAPNGCAAAVVSEELLAARVAFDQYFQPSETSGVVMDLRYAGQTAALKAAGADWVLPWKFASAEAANAPEDDPLRASIESQIRSQVESRLSQGGQAPDPAQVEAMVSRALNQWDSNRAGNTASTSETAAETNRPDVIRHEIAHLLFINELWPSSLNKLEQYGGDAPDWLDEGAAILAESDAMTADRQAAFVEAVNEGTLKPLQEYLDMPHPTFGGGDFQALVEQARAQAENSEITFISAKLPKDHVKQAALYYTQTRGWLDFLIETSQNPRVFADLTQALKAGASLEDWLTMHGPAHNLPEDFDQLQTDFMDWAEALAKN